MSETDQRKIAEVKAAIREGFAELQVALDVVVDDWGPVMLQYETALKSIAKAKTLEEAHAHAKHGLNLDKFA